MGIDTHGSVFIPIVEMLVRRRGNERNQGRIDWVWDGGDRCGEDPPEKFQTHREQNGRKGDPETGRRCGPENGSRGEIEAWSPHTEGRIGDHGSGN